MDFIMHYHVIKTGGTTLLIHLRKNYNNTMFRAGHNITIEDEDKYKEHDIKRVIIIRNPINWLKSQYNQDCARKNDYPDFNYWYDNCFPNRVNPLSDRYNRLCAYVGRFIKDKSLNALKNFLDSCFMVFVTKNLNNDLKYFFEYLNMPTIWSNQRIAGAFDDIDKRFTPKKAIVTEKIENIIRDENREDFELFEYAKKLNKIKLENLKAVLNGR